MNKSEIVEPLARAPSASEGAMSPPLRMFTCDDEEWVIASSPEDAVEVYAHHLGTDAEGDEDPDACDPGLHPSHWTELHGDKVLKRQEECPERHPSSVETADGLQRGPEECPKGCDQHFIIHTTMTVAQWIEAEGRGYWGSANW